MMRSVAFPLLLLLLVGSGCVDSGTAGGDSDAVSPDASIRLASTPQEAIDLFIQGQREGSLVAVRAVLHPPDARFDLPGPVAIESYTIQGSRVLDADEAARESVEGPRREAGDLYIDVVEKYPGRPLKTVTYYVRQIDGWWKIYGWGYFLD